jgi:hypothetical protein
MTHIRTLILYEKRFHPFMKDGILLEFDRTFYFSAVIALKT